MIVPWTCTMISHPALIFSEILMDCLSQVAPDEAPGDLDIELYRYIDPQGRLVDLNTLPNTLEFHPTETGEEGYRKILCAMRARRHLDYF